MVETARKNDIIYLIIYLKKLIDKDLDNRVSEYGLTGQQCRILFFIDRHDDVIHQNDIENAFHLSKSTVSGLVKRMEKNGVITIEKQHPYALIKLSERGLEIINHLKDERENNLERLTKSLNKEDKVNMCEYLIRLIDNMEGGEK